MKIEIVPSEAFFGMVDLNVTINDKRISILCNTVDDAFETLERDGEIITFLLQ